MGPKTVNRPARVVGVPVAVLEIKKMTHQSQSFEGPSTKVVPRVLGAETTESSLVLRVLGAEMTEPSLVPRALGAEMTESSLVLRVPGAEMTESSLIPKDTRS